MRNMEDRSFELVSLHKQRIRPYLFISSLLIYNTNYTSFLYIQTIITKMKNNQFAKVINSTILCLQKYTGNQTLQAQFQAQKISQHLRDIKFEDLHIIQAPKAIKGIGYRNIFEKKGLRITLYNLTEGSVIKLHNHPSMLVASFIFKGKLEAKIYSPTENLLIFNKETFIIKEGEISFIDGLRTNDNNLHELKAIENTYFLDILFPDYDAQRQCVFFEEEEQVGQKEFRLNIAGSDELHFFQI